MSRIIAAFFNSMRALRQAIATEAAVRQEFFLLAAGLVLAPFVAHSLAQAALLIGALLFVLAIELLNTAIEKLSDHVTPEHHEAIGYVKDLGSAAVFCALVLAAFLWGAALIDHILM